MIFSDLYPEPDSTVRDSIIVVRFKVAEPIDLSSFDRSSILVQGSRTGPLTVGIRYTPADSVVQMTIRDRLLRDESIRVILTNRLRLADGRQVPIGVTWSFWVRLLPSQLPAFGDSDPSIELVNVDELPEIIGGMAALLENVVYPEAATERGIEGTVYLDAYVDEIGTVMKVSVVRGIGGGCDEAAVEALQKTRFKPGKLKGEPVKVRISIPIVFILQR